MLPVPDLINPVESEDVETKLSSVTNSFISVYM